MALGGATKKLQMVADMGEELYGRMNELLEQVIETQDTVEDTHERVMALENKVDQQSILLEALAEAHDVDVDAVLTEIAIEDAEASITEDSDGKSDRSDTRADS